MGDQLEQALILDVNGVAAYKSYQPSSLEFLHERSTLSNPLSLVSVGA
jgi:hypothetical protein